MVIKNLLSKVKVFGEKIRNFFLSGKKNSLIFRSLGLSVLVLAIFAGVFFTLRPKILEMSKAGSDEGILSNTLVAGSNEDMLSVTSLKGITGDMNIVMFAVNLKDKKGILLKDYVKSFAEKEFDPFLKAASLNRFNPKTTVYQLDLDTTMCTNYLEVADKVYAEARKLGIPVDAADRVGILYNPECTRPYPAVGLAWGKNFTANAGPTGGFTSLIIHEFYHTLGWIHPTYLTGSGWETVDYYYNALDVAPMYSSNLLSAPNMHKLNWFTDQNVESVDSTGGTYKRYTIYSRKSGNENKILTLKFPKKDTGDYYYVEYRAAVGLEANLDEKMSKGVSLQILTVDGVYKIKNTYSKYISPISVPMGKTPDYANKLYTYTSLEDGQERKDLVGRFKLKQISHNSDYAVVELYLPLISYPKITKPANGSSVGICSTVNFEWVNNGKSAQIDIGNGIDFTYRKDIYSNTFPANITSAAIPIDKAKVKGSQLLVNISTEGNSYYGISSRYHYYVYFSDIYCKQTPTPVPTLKPTLTPTSKPTLTPKPTPTKTATPKPTPTKTATPKPTPTRTATPKPTPTKTPAPKPTKTPTPTPKPTDPADYPKTQCMIGTYYSLSTLVKRGDLSDLNSGWSYFQIVSIAETVWAKAIDERQNLVSSIKFRIKWPNGRIQSFQQSGGYLGVAVPTKGTTTITAYKPNVCKGTDATITIY